MASEDDMPFFDDYVTEDPEVISGGLSPHFGVSGLSTAAANRTIIVSGAGGQLPARNTPAFSYPTAVSSARVGSRAVAPAPLLTSSRTNSPPTFPVAYPNIHSPAVTVAVDPSPSTFPGQAGIDWHSSPTNTSLYNSDSSPAVSTHSSINPFEYVPRNGLPGAARDSYYGEFVAPTNLQNASVQSFDFAYPWAGGGGGGGGDIEIADSSTSMSATDGLPLSSSVPVMPTGGGFRGLESPEADFSGSDGPYEMPSRSPSGPPGVVVIAAATASSSEQSRHKRTKRLSESGSGIGRTSGLYRAVVSNTAGGGGGGVSGSSAGNNTKSRLRSASRTSKNTQHRPSETIEERKNRNSHNLVEKQYRNRLNAQFESLLNALPDTLRPTASASTSGGDGGGDGGDSEGGGGVVGGGGGSSVDLGEKRVSKAEVLDMARRRIRMLEKERDELERERDGLMTTVEKLRDVYEKGSEEESPEFETDSAVKRE